MKPIHCEIDSPSVVLLGNFNPNIFQPGWLAKYDLLSEDAAKTANIEIIRPEISVFTVHDEVRFVVELERCVVEAKTPRREQTVLDLTEGCFRLLEHSPIRALGINRVMHFRMRDEEAWHKIGDRLAPKSVWSTILDKPGMRSVTIEGTREGFASKYRVTVEPSAQIQHGVYVRVNEHHAPETTEGATTLMKTLADRWAAAQRSAKELAEALITRCLEDNP